MGDVVQIRAGRRMPVSRPDTGTAVRERVERMPRANEQAGPPPLWRDVVGAFLRGERLAQERILTEVARRAGVSPQYLSEVERGRKEPSSEVLEAVAGALGLDLTDVVRGVGARLVRERRVIDLTTTTDATGGTGTAPASAPAQPVLLAA
ncbi:helix-turn-helix domain-containing protein [Agromyces rhizosphaerae]|uniref:helix-turn-helix domain-containing protein n=1 Tax=Agromyces rhizosphaerae TaxID=88374 RepID=UPI002852A629|nr:helix-turn-helix transcriptional regulator [Agromyces rhizosphaerae]